MDDVWLMRWKGNNGKEIERNKKSGGGYDGDNDVKVRRRCFSVMHSEHPPILSITPIHRAWAQWKESQWV